MTNDDIVVINEKCVKVCPNESCNLAEFQKGSSKCWKCGGAKYISQPIVVLGDEIVSSVFIASKNPPARPKAASSGFMQLI